MKRTQKYQNFLGHFLGLKHHFLQACDTWIPHKTKLPNYLQKINSILGIFSFFNFWQGFTVVFDANVFFLIFFFFKNGPPQKGVWKGPKSTKIFWGIFWVQNIIFCKLMTSRYLTKKSCRNFLLLRSKNHIYKGISLPWLFHLKKMVIFTTKIWTEIFFPLLMGAPPYLQGIN